MLMRSAITSNPPGLRISRAFTSTSQGLSMWSSAYFITTTSNDAGSSAMSSKYPAVTRVFNSRAPNSAM